MTLRVNSMLPHARWCQLGHNAKHGSGTCANRSCHYRPINPHYESETMSDKTLSLSQIAAACAAAVADAKSAEEKAAAFREAANVEIAKLHKAKAKVGRYNQCAMATAFMDTLTSKGLAKGTSKNALTVFRDAVATGKPVTDWNPSRAKAKAAKAKGKGKGKAELSALLLKARNHADFAEACEVIQAEFQDDKGTFAKCVDSWLEAQGIELKAAE